MGAPSSESLQRQVAGLTPKQRALLARELGLGEPRLPDTSRTLLAYAETAAPATADDLHRFLADRLPEAMVPATIVLMDALPRGRTGKIDRDALPQPETVAELREPDFVEPHGEVEEKLAQIWADSLGMDYVGVDDNFFELGGDSILSIRIIARANEAGLTITPQQFFESPTIAELAAVITPAKPKTASGPVRGRVPLTPIQWWFFDHITPDPHHWNQPVLLECPEELDLAALERALGALWRHHDALRLRFTHDASGWEAFNDDPESHPVSLRIEDLGNVADAEVERAIDATASQLHESFTLSQGRLFGSALFHLGDGRPSRLLIVIHHLVVDAVSWVILLEDLDSAYHQAKAGEIVTLPEKTTSFKVWAEKLVEYAQVPSLRNELGWWLASDGQNIPRLPLDRSGGSAVNTAATADYVTVWLDEPETELLLWDAQQAYRTRVEELLVTALAMAFGSWTGSSSLVIDMEAHGREPPSDDVDVSRTVGWFTTVFPVVVIIDAADDPGRAIMQVKERLRRAPNHGLGHGLLTYLCRDDSVSGPLRSQRTPDVNFNFLGQHTGSGAASDAFRSIDGPKGRARGARGIRPYILEINSAVENGRLRTTWTYSTRLHDRATIDGLAREYLRALQVLINHCLSDEAGGATPMDFPLANLDQVELDRIADMLEHGDGPG